MNQVSHIRLGYFTPSAISEVAQRHGYYRAAGLEVEELPVKSSPQQFDSLRSGDYDLVLTAPDNVATYRFNDDNPLGQRLDVRMVAGVDAGTGLSLIARPGVGSVTQLRGAKVAVDVPTSGFALVLYAILEQHGMHADRDVELVSAGSTPRRWDALRAGEFDATLLNAGFDVVAENAGYTRLAEVGDVVVPYLGTVVAAMGRTIDESPELVTSFLSAWARAREHVLDPRNRAEVVELTAAQLSLPRESAEQFTDRVLAPSTGLVADGTVPTDALGAVLELRSGQGGFRPDRTVAEMLDPASGLVHELQAVSG